MYFDDYNSSKFFVHVIFEISRSDEVGKSLVFEERETSKDEEQETSKDDEQETSKEDEQQTNKDEDKKEKKEKNFAFCLNCNTQET